MTGPGTNSYLIEAQRRCLLDPGPDDERQYDSLMRAVGEAGLDYILVTHTHRDHSPGAGRLQRATGAELIGLSPPDSPGQDQSFASARVWRDGDRLDCGDCALRMIHTPGHVSNHFCYLLEEERLLFTGDHLLQGTTPVILPPDGDMADYLRSLERLLELDLDALAPGHGHLMSNPAEEINRVIAHRLRREAKIIDRLSGLGATPIEDLLPRVYDDVAAHLLPWARQTLLAHLLKLQGEGRAECRDKQWKLL